MNNCKTASDKDYYKGKVKGESCFCHTLLRFMSTQALYTKTSLRICGICSVHVNIAHAGVYG